MLPSHRACTGITQWDEPFSISERSGPWSDHARYFLKIILLFVSVAEIASTDKQINLKLEIQTSKMVDNCFRLDILECELVLLSKLFIFRRDLLGEKKAIQDMNICLPKCPDQDVLQVFHNGPKILWLPLNGSPDPALSFNDLWQGSYTSMTFIMTEGISVTNMFYLSSLSFPHPWIMDLLDCKFALRIEMIRSF